MWPNIFIPIDNASPLAGAQTTFLTPKFPENRENNREFFKNGWF
jgi:hypothetical protein